MPSQVHVAFEEADQLDMASNAFVKGAKSEPQQPALLQMRQLMDRADELVVIADASNVRGQQGNVNWVLGWQGSMMWHHICLVPQSFAVACTTNTTYVICQ